MLPAKSTAKCVARVLSRGCCDTRRDELYRVSYTAPRHTCATAPAHTTPCFQLIPFMAALSGKPRNKRHRLTGRVMSNRRYCTAYIESTGVPFAADISPVAAAETQVDDYSRNSLLLATSARSLAVPASSASSRDTWSLAGLRTDAVQDGKDWTRLDAGQDYWQFTARSRR